jgi:hypothetical protein
MLCRGLAERYMAQIPGCLAALEQCDIACVSAVWNVIRLRQRRMECDSPYCSRPTPGKIHLTSWVDEQLPMLTFILSCAGERDKQPDNEQGQEQN